MNKKIREMVDELFTGRTVSAEELALRDEVMANAQARFEDMIAHGANEEEALDAVEESLGDVEELLEKMNDEADSEDVRAELEKFFNDLGNWGVGAIRDLDKATDGTLLRFWHAARSGMETVQQAAAKMGKKPAEEEKPEEAPVSDFAAPAEPEAEETPRAEQLRSKAKDLQAQAAFKRLTGDPENAEMMEQEAAALIAQADEAERSDIEALEAAVSEAKRTVDEIESEMDAFGKEAETWNFADAIKDATEKKDTRDGEKPKSGDDWSFGDFISDLENREDPADEAEEAPAEAPQNEPETDEDAADDEETEPESEEEPGTDEDDAVETAINDALNTLGDAVDQMARGAMKAIDDSSAAVEDACKPNGTEITVSGTACYDVTGVHSICVQTESEDVRVEPTAGGRIEVLWEDSRSDCQPEITLEDHVLSVRCKSGDPLKSFFSVFKGKTGCIVIRVPQGLAAEYDIVTASGAVVFEGPDADEIRAASTSGALTLKPDPQHCLRLLKGQTVSGDLTVSACADDIKAKTISGRLFITGHAEGMEASTSSGSLYIEGSAAQWEAGTVSGNMELVCTEIPAGRIKLNTLSASAKVTLPSDIHGFTAEVSGVNAAIENEFGANRYGTGTLPIHLDTVSGKLIIMKL